MRICNNMCDMSDCYNTDEEMEIYDLELTDNQIKRIEEEYGKFFFDTKNPQHICKDCLDRLLEEEGDFFVLTYEENLTIKEK